MIEVLTSVNSEITNVDDAFFNKVLFGGKSGILHGCLNDCVIYLSAPNIITLDTGELLIYGVRVRITEAISFTFTSLPLEKIDYDLIAEINLMKDKTITCDIGYQTAGKILSKEAIYKNGEGIYQIQLCNFSHLPSGEIGDIVKKMEIVRGGNSGINIGTVKVATIPSNSPATVKVENIYNANKTLEEVNFDFQIPRGEPNKLRIGKVSNGNEASAEIIGEAGNQTLNLTLTKGDKGEKGDRGEVGPPNKLRIGTVSSGEASAEIIGEAGNQALNLTLPKGDKGDKGDRGEVGPPNKLRIGTVSSGEVSNAEIIGEAGNQTLNLVLEKGAIGTAGADGFSGWVTLDIIRPETGLQFNKEITLDYGMKPKINDWVICANNTVHSVNGTTYMGNVGIVKEITGYGYGSIRVSVEYVFSLRGPIGKSFVFKGSWSNNFTYSKLDIVDYNGYVDDVWWNAVYVSVVDNNKNKCPMLTGDTPEWKRLCVSRDGRKGDKGDKGDRGEVGPPNKLRIGTVSSGEVSNAEIIGEAGNQTLNLTLPKGDKGDKGDRGDIGPANQLKIGIVTKGDDAAAEIIGQAGVNQFLNLTLPKGDKGSDGVIQEISAGYFALNVNEEGHLILTYADGDTPPDFHINNDGHLILTI